MLCVFCLSYVTVLAQRMFQLRGLQDDSKHEELQRLWQETILQPVSSHHCHPLFHPSFCLSSCLLRACAQSVFPPWNAGQISFAKHCTYLSFLSPVFERQYKQVNVSICIGVCVCWQVTYKQIQEPWVRCSERNFHVWEFEFAYFVTGQQSRACGCH